MSKAQLVPRSASGSRKVSGALGSKHVVSVGMSFMAALLSSAQRSAQGSPQPGAPAPPSHCSDSFGFARVLLRLFGG